MEKLLKFTILQTIGSQNILGWKRLLGSSSSTPAWHEQGHFSLDGVFQSPVQSDHEYFQQWGTYHFSGQPTFSVSPAYFLKILSS